MRGIAFVGRVMNKQFAMLIAMDHFLNRLMTMNMFYHMIVVFHQENAAITQLKNRMGESIEKKMAVNQGENY